jgi:agmatine/peptidylarginine deiminase
MRSISLILFGLILFTSLNGLTPDQHRWLKDHPGETPNWILPGEVFRNQRDFEPTDPPSQPVRPVAEFESMTGALVRYNYGLDIPVSLVAAMSQQVNVLTIVSSSSQIDTATNAYIAAGANPDNLSFMLAPTDTEWTRDYGPMFVFDGTGTLGVVDFPYNRPRPEDDDVPVEYADYDTLNLYGMNITHTGGNFMSDGLGQACSTELVWTENSSLTHDEVAQLAEDYLGILTYHVLPDPLGDYIEHVDCWGKFLAVDKVLIGQVPASDTRYEDYEAVAEYFANITSSWGTPFKVYRVYTPGGTLVTPYTNSLILNDHVYVPQSGCQWDDEAITAYQAAMPGYTIVGINYDAWYNTDALHCRVHELPDKGMLYVNHTPLTDQLESHDMAVNAYIHPYSNASLYNDSLRVYYRVNTGNWQYITMSFLGNEQYQAMIPSQPIGSVVDYYIYAADQSGRHICNPLVGEAGPYSFGFYDSVPPVVEHTPLTTMQYNDLPVTISATAIDNVGVTSVTVRHWTNNATTPVDLALTEGTGNVWSGQFTAEMFNLYDTVCYQVITSDAAGNTTTLPPQGAYSFILDGTSVDEPAFAQPGLTLYPNPCRGTSLRLMLSLPASAPVRAEIFNLRGQQVCTLSGKQPSGNSELVWDGRDANGKSVAEGVYLVRITAGDKQIMRKALLMK